MVEKTVARTSLGVVKTSLGAMKTSLGVTKTSLGVVETSLGVVKTSLEVVKTSLEVVKTSLGKACVRTTHLLSSSAISQSSLVSSPKSSRGSAAALNAVTRCSIHCISNILQSGRGSLSGSFVSR
jgi:hypothetical protein